MLKTERILGIIFLSAIILNFFPLKGTSILVVLSSGILGMMYFLVGFSVINNIKFKDIFKEASYKSVTTGRVVGAIFTGFILSTAVNAILFNSMNWVGGKIISLLALASIIVCFIVAFLKYNKLKSDFYAYVLIRLAFYGVLTLIMFFTQYSMF